MVGECAADSSQESTEFFLSYAKCLWFFLLLKSSEELYVSYINKCTLKRKSDTRWSARYDMCYGFLKNWNPVIISLINIKNSTYENAITKNEAKGLFCIK
jgi:hypothetical protein